MGALFLSCESETGAGVLVGGGNGALVGYLGEGGSCAIIGAGVGAGVIVGGLIGATLDNENQKHLKQENKKT